MAVVGGRWWSMAVGGGGGWWQSVVVGGAEVTGCDVVVVAFVVSTNEGTISEGRHSAHGDTHTRVV